MSREARKRCGRPRDRRGTILVLSAVLMIVMMGFIALSVDSGYMMNVQTEMDRAVDAGALAGAGALPAGYGAADSTARDIVSLNPVGSQALFGDELMIEAGTWHEAPNGDPNGRWFEPGTDMPDAVRVTAQRNDQRPLFFANVFGHDEFDLGSTAVAMFQPRDIMLVLDYSASMNDDSEFRSIDTLGRESVESNLLEIYGDLGSPVFGNLNFDPNWMTIPGKSPANEHQPQIYVEYRYSEVYVTSTKPFSKVNVHKYNGSYKTYEGSGTWNDSRGVYEQTLDYNGNSRIGKVFVESGYNDSDHSEGNLYEETFELYSTDDIRDAAKLAWGLNGVDYPYPQGGWDEWISYCISSRNDNKKAGYRYKFGYMNWVNYLLDDRPSYDESPDLWKTSEQPVTAVKNSVDVFIDFMQEYNTTDRVGMALYNSEDGWGQLEQELTTNYILVSHLARERQAGHYHNSTNIAAGLDTAREELNAHVRENAVKMIILMTDGRPTFPYNTNYATDLALEAAEHCASDEIPVHTISLGLGADTALMQEIADMTAGVHYNVPGGRPIEEVEEDLRDTFKRIAKERPLKLVAADRYSAE